MHDTKHELLAAVAARLADRRTGADNRAEQLLAIIAVTMTAFTIYGAVRMILALVW